MLAGGVQIIAGGSWVGALVPRLIHGEATEADHLAGGATAGAAGSSRARSRVATTAGKGT